MPTRSLLLTVAALLAVAPRLAAAADGDSWHAFKESRDTDYSISCSDGKLENRARDVERTIAGNIAVIRFTDAQHRPAEWIVTPPTTCAIEENVTELGTASRPH